MPFEVSSSAVVVDMMLVVMNSFDKYATTLHHEERCGLRVTQHKGHRQKIAPQEPLLGSLEQTKTAKKKSVVTLIVSIRCVGSVGL